MSKMSSDTLHYLNSYQQHKNHEIPTFIFSETLLVTKNIMKYTEAIFFKLSPPKLQIKVICAIVSSGAWATDGTLGQCSAIYFYRKGAPEAPC